MRKSGEKEEAKRQVGFGRRALRCYNGKRSLWMGIFPIVFKIRRIKNV